MAVSVIFWTTVNAFDTPSDERVLQAPNGASRDRHQCVLAGHLARALDRTRWPPQTISTPNSAAMPIKALSTAIISNRSRSRSLSRRSNTSPQDCRQRTRIRLSAFRPDGAEPLCLFLVTSASWRLRGVKRPPNKEATESSHREPWPANAGALSVRGNEAKPRVIRQNENPVRACDVGAPRAGSREPSGVGDTKGMLRGLRFANSRAVQRFLTERPARTAHKACALGNAGSLTPHSSGSRSRAPRLRPF